MTARLESLLTARRGAYAVLAAASDEASAVRRRTQRDDPARTLAEDEVNVARRAYERATDEWVMAEYFGAGAAPERKARVVPPTAQVDLFGGRS